MNAIDTNILVYAVDSTEPVKSRQAIHFIQSLRSVPLVVPWQVAVEFLACLRRWEGAGRIRREDTEEYLKRFVLSLPIVHPTVNSLPLALGLTKQYSLSYWDSLLLAACIEAGVTTLYSEDLSSGVQSGTVKVLNPFAAVR